MNFIFLYVGYGILWRYFFFSWEMDEFGFYGEKLVMSMIGIVLWVFIVYYFFIVKVFFKV